MAMTRDDIIRMAHEAGFEVDENHDVWITNGYWLRELERFADLVAAMEREACAKVAEWVGQDKNHIGIAAAIRARGHYD